MSNTGNCHSFQLMLKNLENDPNWQRLPDIRIAMAPHQARFSDDLSDRTLFNDRYIESRVLVGKMAFALRLTCAGFLASLIILAVAITSGVQAGKSWGEAASPLWVIALLSVLLFVLAYRLAKAEPVFVRFNRQAQLVHVYRGENQTVSAPWREVHPFTKFSASGDGKFSLTLVFRVGPSDLDAVSGAFDIGDESALIDNLVRLEFLRRYMAEGLSAVQPDPASTPHKPSGFSATATREEGLLDCLIEKLVMRPGYYLTGGCWVDRYLLRRAANVRWPAEVERLCAPGADLSSYDITPVQSRKDAYHRFNGYGFDLVDIEGEVIG
ncbi:DUF6708 domain-containing protein [Achromobacter mucicolens]|uniref:DUF6708 domain-containing protein n=1 Tax=Achromobacter mucicolens TaxID=1389922 RepID=UPI003975F936